MHAKVVSVKSHGSVLVLTIYTRAHIINISSMDLESVNDIIPLSGM